MPHSQMELKAESVSCLVSKRRGLDPHSPPYLSQFFQGEEPPAMPDTYEVMRVAGRVEQVLNRTCVPALSTGRQHLATWTEEQYHFDFGR